MGLTWCLPPPGQRKRHHKDIDKTRYPDIGMRGQVVREKLHGRTAQGTGVHAGGRATREQVQVRGDLAEIAGASTDLVLARHQGRLHVFHRDPDDQGKLAAGTPDGKDMRATLVGLLT